MDSRLLPVIQVFPVVIPHCFPYKKQLLPLHANTCQPPSHNQVKKGGLSSYTCAVDWKQRHVQTYAKGRWEGAGERLSCTTKC